MASMRDETALPTSSPRLSRNSLASSALAWRSASSAAAWAIDKARLERGFGLGNRLGDQRADIGLRRRCLGLVFGIDRGPRLAGTWRARAEIGQKIEKGSGGHGLHRDFLGSPFAQDLRGALLIEVDHAGKPILWRGPDLLAKIVERSGTWA